ncbi:hypothetical protein [Calothrix sp. 336/3]|uniref:hypothetical protein n=1 Tax=Calothrix sp. 336/3 TaxID=1337936 RepID=UPI00143A17C0|nr:hypothetical protein [Calothrix sp. 336/3]
MSNEINLPGSKTLRVKLEQEGDRSVLQSTEFIYQRIGEPQQEWCDRHILASFLTPSE